MKKQSPLLSVLVITLAGCGESTLAVPDAPTAVITAPATDVTVTMGQAIDFQGSGTDTDGVVVGHSWSFGDGGVSGVEDPGSYTYASAGSYAVSYTVTDDGISVDVGTQGAERFDPRIASNTVSIEVAPINDPPQFSGPSNVLVMEDAKVVPLASRSSRVRSPAACRNRRSTVRPIPLSPSAR